MTHTEIRYCRANTDSPKGFGFLQVAPDPSNNSSLFFFFLCIFVYACNCVCVCEYVCTCVEVWGVWCMCRGQRTTSGVNLWLPPCLGQGLCVDFLHYFFSHTIWLASFQGLCPLPSPYKDAGIIDACTTWPVLIWGLSIQTQASYFHGIYPLSYLSGPSLLSSNHNQQQGLYLVSSIDAPQLIMRHCPNKNHNKWSEPTIFMA